MIFHPAHEGQRRVIVSEGRVALAQPLKSAAEVVERPALPRLLLDLALDGEAAAQIGERRVDASEREIHASEIDETDRRDGSSPALLERREGAAVVHERRV